MTANEQIAFVNELTGNIAKDIIAKIDTGRLPKDWDGHELRALIADKAVDAADMSVIRKHPRSERGQNYKNAVIIYNL